MKIPIVFAANNAYVKQLATVITFILEHSNSANFYEFFILNNDINEKNQSILNSYVNLFKNAKVNFIDMKEIIGNINLEKYMSRRKKYNYISIETYFRFFIPELFKNYEKILYLDADILVLKDVAELFSENIENYYCAAVNDSFMETNLKSHANKTSQYKNLSYRQYFEMILNKKELSYFNAGVILFNVKKMINDDITSKLWKFVEEKSPLEFQDQDVLNAVFEGAIKYVDGKWNTLKKNNDNINDAYIYHFVGPEKPWAYCKRGKYNYSYINDWWNYYEKTPFYAKEDVRMKNKIKHRENLSKIQNNIQSLFALKNDGDDKILTLFGFKFKFKRKIKQINN